MDTQGPFFDPWGQELISASVCLAGWTSSCQCDGQEGSPFAAASERFYCPNFQIEIDRPVYLVDQCGCTTILGFSNLGLR